MGQTANIRLVLREAERLCQTRGVRLTAQRRAVLEIICTRAKPMGAYEILASMRAGVPGAAPPTVYRALEFLLAQGLVHKLETIHAFVGCNHPDHPHASQFLICEGCGDVTEVEDPEVVRSLQRAALAVGFRTDKRVVEVVGTCADCSSLSGDR